MAALPAIKLLKLVISHVSRPIAQRCKEYAKSNPFFRNYICLPPAHLFNWCELKSKMWVLNLGKPINIPPLSEAKAIELGANLVSEGILYLFATGLMMIELLRSRMKGSGKENERVNEIKTINNQIQSLYEMLEAQRQCIQKLTLAVQEVQTKLGIKEDPEDLDKVQKHTKNPQPPPNPVKPSPP